MSDPLNGVDSYHMPNVRGPMDLMDPVPNRLRALAQMGASAFHRVDVTLARLNGTVASHVDPEETCSHPDCVLVRSSAPVVAQERDPA